MCHPALLLAASYERRRMPTLVIKNSTKSFNNTETDKTLKNVRSFVPITLLEASNPVELGNRRKTYMAKTSTI